MKSIDTELGNKVCEAQRTFENAKKELYSVLVQDEYIQYFSACTRGECQVYLEEEHRLHDLAERFSRQIKAIWMAIRYDKARLALLCQKYKRTEDCVTVAYEQISDEELARLSAEDIVTIYLGEIAHQRWGGVWKALFTDPFFLKSLLRLRDLLKE